MISSTRLGDHEGRPYKALALKNKGDHTYAQARVAATNSTCCGLNKFYLTSIQALDAFYNQLSLVAESRHVVVQ